MALTWNPAQYGKFSGPRLQPGLDLLARVPDVRGARAIVDLGCGTGELTALLAERFPDAQVEGLDSSAAMLERANKAYPKLIWTERDLRDWVPAAKLDVIFSNAALQWVGGHELLFPRLLNALRPGGVLAVQMPRNFAAPSHAVMREVAALPQYAGRIALRVEPVLPPERYYDLLSPLATVELWETEYLHVLDGDDPVFEWTRGTAMLPVMQALQGEELEAFSAEYKARLRAAYPKRADGKTLFPFRRIFLLARLA